MQGGASLEAYEAGAFKAIYEKIDNKNSSKNDLERDRHFFDIVAGTSIGAIHGAIIVNYVVQNRKKGKSMYASWKGVDQVLCDFWEDISTLTYIEMDPHLILDGIVLDTYIEILPIQRLLEDIILLNNS